MQAFDMARSAPGSDRAVAPMVDSGIAALWLGLVG
jgi:hypothetical protein